MVDLIFIGMVYEIIVIAIISILLALIYKKYLAKKQKLTLYLFLIFLSYLFGIIFSCFSKVLVIYSGIEYVYNATASDPGTPISWILLRIIDFRISFIFVTLSIYLSYVLKVNVFAKGYNHIQRIIVIVYSIFTGLYCFIVYQRGNTMLDVFAFLLVFIFMFMIYIPFMVRALNSYRSVSEPIFKKAFLSLAIMSVSFTLVFFCFLIDRVLILLGSPGFTIFYFLAWSFVIVSIVFAYLGYIKPKAK